MRSAPSTRVRPHRAVGIYLCAVVLPTLALLYLGYDSVLQQNAALEEKNRSNARLTAGRLADEIERRVLDLARECVRDPALVDVIGGLPGPDRPDIDRRIRTALQGIAERHPIAASLLLAQGDAVRVPLLSRPVPRALASYVDGEATGDQAALRELLRQADLADLPRNPPNEAAGLYRQVLTRAQSPALRALALARLARAARRSGDDAEARRLYRQLLAQGPDEYDPLHQPYALVAALELQALERASRDAAPAEQPNRERLRQDIAAGRWEMTLDAAEWFSSELREAGAGSDPGRQPTPFQAHVKVAEAFARDFRSHGVLHPDQVYPLPVDVAGTAHQLLYILAPETAHAVRPEIVVSLDVDLGWVKATLLPDVSRSLQLGEPTPELVRSSPSGGQKTPTVPGVAFRTLFPFWHVVPSPAAATADREAMTRRAWVFGGATALLMGVLVLGIVLLARDVSRERRLTQFKADLVAGVSHELKTPLTVIRLYAETLGGSLPLTDADRAEYGEIILRESDRLTALIDRVLSYSRLEQRGRTYALLMGDLSAAVKIAVDVYGPVLHRRGFEITFEPGDTALTVPFDADAVIEAVLNLLDNAAKYSGDSRWIGVRLVRRPSMAVVEVEDRGLGIGPEDRERIFEEYYRARPETPRAGSGSGHGLGLYLVQHIMAGHGGTVEVESQRGVGSTFRLVFPQAVDGAVT